MICIGFFDNTTDANVETAANTQSDLTSFRALLPRNKTMLQ